MALVFSHSASGMPSPPRRPRSWLIASSAISSAPSVRAIARAAVDLPEKERPHVA